MRKRRALPRSRDELRKHGGTRVPPPLPPQLYHNPESTQTVQVFVQAPSSSCLHTPLECSIYRKPWDWCSSCKVKAASVCAQNGMPNVGHLFQVPAICNTVPTACYPRPICPQPPATTCFPPETCSHVCNRY